MKVPLTAQPLYLAPSATSLAFEQKGGPACIKKVLRPIYLWQVHL